MEKSVSDVVHVNDVKETNVGVKVKEMDNNERKQSEFSIKDPIELDVEKRKLFFRKAFSCAVVIIICTATSVAWMVGPLVAFNKPREVSVGNNQIHADI